MRAGQFWLVVLVAASVAWALVIVDRGPASAGDPLFTAMRVSHLLGDFPAPGFVLSTPEKKTVALADFRGKVVFLNFWATWCPPCRLEMPSMERLHR
ncbi:MAG: TlpA family protein disulfide reductase, partial [Anaerolineae bacterium]